MIVENRYGESFKIVVHASSPVLHYRFFAVFNAESLKRPSIRTAVLLRTFMAFL